MRLRDLLVLSRLKQRLSEAPLPNGQAFACFALVTLFDGLQLAILDGSAHAPGPWGPAAAGASFAVGVVFVLLSFVLNGGTAGVDYFARYFSLCAVIGLYTAGPLQILLRLPALLPAFEPPDWYAPALVLGTNLLMFSWILASFADVARRTRWPAARASAPRSPSGCDNR
jgi:hypothetical protein